MMDFYLNNPVTALFFESRKPEAERNQSLIDQSTPLRAAPSTDGTADTRSGMPTSWPPARASRAW